MVAQKTDTFFRYNVFEKDTVSVFVKKKKKNIDKKTAQKSDLPPMAAQISYKCSVRVRALRAGY